MNSPKEASEQLEMWEQRAATLREKLADHSKLTGSDDPMRIMALEVGLSVIEDDLLPSLRADAGNPAEGDNPKSGGHR